MHALKHLFLASAVLSLTALGAEPLKVFPGWPVQLGDAEKATSADPAVATVALTGKAATVTGKKEGRTTIALTGKGGATRTIELEVQSSGWKLVPVAVAARDLAEGTVLTAETLAQRSVPEFLFTSSVVKPDATTYVIGQRILIPLQAGDMLTWTAVATTKNAPKP
jgi:Flp pilus assembly protein CpaB